MFENMIGQGGAVAALRQELAAGRFPRSALFSGPRWAGKLTAALETARVLTCSVDGAWGCECGSCRLQRELAHPDTVILGWRPMEEEIAASAQAWHANRSVPTRFLLVRAVRKLLRRFDPAIWDAEEARQRAARERISAIEDLLADDAHLEERLEKLVELSTALAASVRSDHVTVGQVRLLASWAHLGVEPKVAILDNADRMLESARNAALKLLEEPPQSVHLLLTTSRRSAIIPTVLSRVRPYSFVQRKLEEEREVISRIFRQDPAGFDGLRSFFLAWREPGIEPLQAAARRLMEAATRPGAALELPGELAPVTARGSSPERVLAFLEELARELGALLRAGTLDVELAEPWIEAVRDCQGRIDQLNIRPENALLALLARMRRQWALARGAA